MSFQRVAAQIIKIATHCREVARPDQLRVGFQESCYAMRPLAERPRPPLLDRELPKEEISGRPGEELQY
jgi:hypothetical protein